MKTYKALAAGLALAGLLTASVASAQTASTTPVSGPDLLVNITNSGIVLDATHSSQPITVSGLPFSIGGGAGGSCTLMNGGTNLGVIGTTGNTGAVEFPTAGTVTVPAGSSVTLSVNCTGATAGSYPVTLTTSLIPAIVANTNTSITPHGSDNTTVARGTLSINGSGSVGGITPTPSTGSGSGSVLGTSTGSSLPGSTSGSASGSVSGSTGTGSATPGVPNTGDGGAMAVNLTILVLAALAAVGGTYALRRYAR